MYSSSLSLSFLTLAISDVCSADNQRYSDGGGVPGVRLVLPLIVVGELGRRGLDRIDGNRGDVSVTCRNMINTVTHYNY